jgi:hypothetical protein
MVDLDGSFAYSQVVLIKDTETNEPFGIYPNPARNAVTLTHELLSRESEVVILDMSGRQVLRVTAISGTNQTRLNIGKLQGGLYIITLTNGENQKSIKLFKE